MFKKLHRMFLKLKNNEKGVLPIVAIVWVVIALVAAGTGVAIYANWPAILKGLVSAAMLILVSVSTSLAGFAGQFFKAVASLEILQKPITQDPSVRHGWLIVRDFANMFIVLGFVIVGIATILRLREYEAQKALLPLILVALLINFSLLFCGIVIDATNIAMRYFTQISGPNGIVDPILAAVTDPTTINNIKALSKADETNPQFISGCVSLSIFAGVGAMLFFIYGVLFLFRYVALMCLVILSPLAFVCYVFPATKQIFNKWWSQFLQWAIIGVPSAFFVYLAGHLIQTYNTAGAAQSASALGFWIPTAFLLFAYTLIFQTSALGAGAAIGLATGAAAFAWGATKWAGGKALRGAGSAIKESDTGKKISGGVQRAMERIPIIGGRPGSTAFGRLEEQRKTEKRMKDLYAQDKDRGLKLLEGKGRVNSQERAALASIALDKGDFDKNNAKHMASLGIMQDQGYDMHEVTKKRPDLAPNDRKLMAKLTAPIAKGGSGLSQDDAKQEAIKQAITGQTHRELVKNISAKSLEDLDVLDNLDILNPSMKNAFAKASPKKVASLKKFSTASADPNSPFAKLNQRITDLTAAGNTAKATELVNKQIEIASIKI